MQQKDVIYIDVEDDITAIIGKVQASKEKIVAIVPPKRTSILQSAVNLRLLARAAEKSNKNLVLVTGNAALSGLAASAKIPVAKTLQSRPELAEIPTVDDDDDVIDGEQLPVGVHEKIDNSSKEIIPASSIKGLDIDGEAETETPSAAKSSAKKASKVPDFGSFRKRLVLGIIGGSLLISFFVWAIWFAPHATIVITAKTTPVEIKTPLTVGEGIQTDNSKNTITSITETDKVSTSVDFTATGTKDIGEKASGTVVFANCQDITSLTINAGTYISSGGNNYVVQSTIIVPGGTGNFITGCTSAGVSAPVKVIATDIGDSYNTAAGAQFTVAGFSSKMSASSSAGITGGTKKTVTVVTTTDVQTAQQQLAQQNTNDIKKKLRSQFDSNVTIIEDSFTATPANPKSVPAIGEEAPGGKAKLTSDVTYSMVGVPQPALDDYLTEAITKQLTNPNQQRIYYSGAQTAKLTGYQLAADQKTATVQLAATGQVGPKIDDATIKEQVKGKRAGKVIGDLKAIDGVSDVEVKLSPFWVQTVPDDVKKITIEFKLQKNNG